MAIKLTDAMVRALDPPQRGQIRVHDSAVSGFGCRITAKGVAAFILNYRTRGGRERRITIGRFPDWTVAAARQEARDLKRAIDRGEDPMEMIEADRNAKTVAQLCDRFVADHLPRLRPRTRIGYQALIDNEIRPKLGRLKVGEVSFADIDDLHRKVTARGAPYAANRTVAVLSKMFSKCIRWGWRVDNPAQGIERNQEIKRQRYLSPQELVGLSKALAVQDDQQGANIIRLLSLTGARKSEVLTMQWEQLDLDAGTWIKPGATTKQKTDHRVPLSAPACQVLRDIFGRVETATGYVFPGRGSPHRIDIKKTWRAVCIDAGLVKQEIIAKADGRECVVLKPSARIHDLRHTYASILASSNLSLPIIGALLGHTQPATTQRYAHLLDDPLRAATEKVGAVLTASEDIADSKKYDDWNAG